MRRLPSTIVLVVTLLAPVAVASTSAGQDAGLQDGSSEVGMNQRKPAVFVWVEDEDKVHGFVTGLPRSAVKHHGIKIYAITDTAYRQPFVGDVHSISWWTLTFETWTRPWRSLRADLVDRRTNKVIASATHYRGQPRPTQPPLPSIWEDLPIAEKVLALAIPALVLIVLLSALFMKYRTRRRRRRISRQVGA